MARIGVLKTWKRCAFHVEFAQKTTRNLVVGLDRMAVLSRWLRSKSCMSCFGKTQRGSVALEFALLSGPFFLLLMGVVELCLMEGAQQLLENAAFNASRLAKTGYVAEDMTQEQTITEVLNEKLSVYGSLIDVSKVAMTEEVYSSFTNVEAGGGSSGYGTEQQIVAYTLTYPWKVFTPLMCAAFGSACTEDSIIHLYSKIVVRNEPYGD